MSASPKCCSPATVYISLGSNRALDNSLTPDKILDQALAILAKTPGLSLEKVSGRYLTSPQGETNQPWFINQVVRLESRLEPLELLARLMEIETELGRIRDPNQPAGPRTLDLDMLLYGQTIMAGPDLILPHPRLDQRAFVLVPLLELAPNLILPDGRLARDILDSLSYKAQDNRIEQ